MPSSQKARTVAQKRRGRRKRGRGQVTLPGGATAPQRAAQGRRSDLDPDPQQTVRLARIRQGLTPEQARHEMAGSPVGRRLLLDHLPDREELWQAVRHIIRVTAAYDLALGAPRRHAKCLDRLTTLDALHADAASPAPDLRSDEERHRQAVTAWTTMHGWLAYTDRAAASACLRHVQDEPDEPIADWTGIVLALRCVADGIHGRRVQVRDRRRL